MRIVSQIISALFYGLLSTIALAQPVITPPPVLGNPTLGTLPSYNDASANWKNAGLLSVGGIPNRTTQCGATVNPTGGDDTTTIQAAINACTAGQVVQLSAGTFLVSMADMIRINKGITLRGTGTCSGTLTYSGGAGTPSFGPAPNALCSTVIVQNDGLTHVNNSRLCSGGACSGNPLIFMAPSQVINGNDWVWSNCSRGTWYVDQTCGGTIAGLTADAAKGDTVIHVNTTAPFTVGAWVMITEASGGLSQADSIASGVNVWAPADMFSASGSPATGRAMFSKHLPTCCGDDYGTTVYPYTTSPSGEFSMIDRPTAEIHLITAIGAGPCPCTITFDDPLTVAFRQSGGAQFTGFISGTTLTVTSVASGTIKINEPLTDVASLISGATAIVSQSSGTTGGTGNYTINNSQTVGSVGAPIAMAAGGYAAKVLYPTKSTTATAVPFLTNAGIENLTLQRGNSGNLVIVFCAYCWAKNVDSSEMASGAFEVMNSARVQLDTVFGHECWNNINQGAEYPFDFSWGSTEILLVNSISIGCGKNMTARAGGAGSVVAYNYMDVQYYGSGSNLEYGLIDASLNGSHYAGSHHILFEGNWAENFLADHVHGNSVYHTYFRNFGAGYRTPFTDHQSAHAVNDFTNTGETPWPLQGLRVVVPSAYTYWMAYVGNVLGTAGSSTSGNGWTYQTGTGTPAGINIWDLGVEDATGSYDKNLSGVTGSYYHRHGNYDTVTPGIADWNAAYSRALPPSYYLSAKPAFFTGTSCAYPWPPVTPAGGTQLPSPTGPGACTTSSGFPPKARYDAGTPFVQQ